MPTRIAKQLRHGAARAAVIIGGLLITAGIITGLIRSDGLLSEDLYKIGLALIIGGATGWVLAKTSATEQYVEMVRQRAFDEGVSEGCDMARIMSLRAAPTDPAPLSLAGPPEEFCEEFGVGDAADRAG